MRRRFPVFAYLASHLPALLLGMVIGALPAAWYAYQVGYAEGAATEARRTFMEHDLPGG